VAILFYLFWSLYICYTIAAVNVLFIIVAFFVRPFSRVTARRLNEWMMSHLWPIYGYCLEVCDIFNTLLPLHLFGELTLSLPGSRWLDDTFHRRCSSG
jgi:hypothetical protein